MSRAHPVRGYSKKDSSSLPHAKACQFLYRASLEMAQSCPEYASYLGRRCLDMMERGHHHHGLSRVQISHLCRRCGCPLSVVEGCPVTLSQSCVRRSRRKKAAMASESSTKKVMHGGVLKTCRLCHNNYVHKYPTREMAEEKLMKSAG